MPSATNRAQTSVVSLPTLHGSTLLLEGVAQEIYAVNFYPFTKPGIDHVFALTLIGGETIVCRISEDVNKVLEVLRWFKNEDETIQLNALCWSYDLVTGEPLLCVSGETTSKIFVLNATTGSLVKTYIRHGGKVNDLKTHPLVPNIVASCSIDHSIRLWDLAAEDDNKACKVMLAGEYHRGEIKMIAFHHTGRYMIAGSMDSSVSLWRIPSLHASIPDDDDDELEVDGGTLLVRYSHFSSFEIHGDHIDCIEFYGDFIISKSAREPIISMWRITGFDSTRQPRPYSHAPMTGPAVSQTRSAYCRDTKNAFQIVMRFHAPNAETPWVHFGLFHSLVGRPLLLAGSNNLTISIWDLQALEDNVFGDVHIPDYGVKGSRYPAMSRKAEEVVKTRKGEWEGPFKAQLPHKIIKLPYQREGGLLDKQSTRAFSFAVGGEWCAVVGDMGLVAILRRDEQLKKFKSKS